MADGTDTTPSATERLAQILGLPAPAPLDEASEAAFQRALRDGDHQVAAVAARRRADRARRAA